MTYHLFLDDVRSPADVTWEKLPSPEQWIIARNFWAFKRQIEKRGIPKFVAFDHDLAPEHYSAMFKDSHSNPSDYGNEKTGFHCAEYLIHACAERSVPFPEYTVHSLNPVGRQRMYDLIEEAKLNLL